MKKMVFSLTLTMAIGAIPDTNAAIKRPATTDSVTNTDLYKELGDARAKRSKTAPPAGPIVPEESMASNSSNTGTAFRDPQQKAAKSRKRRHEQVKICLYTENNNPVEFTQPKAKRTKSQNEVPLINENMTPEELINLLRNKQMDKESFVTFATNAITPGFEITREIAEDIFANFNPIPERSGSCEWFNDATEEETFRTNLKLRLNDKNAFIEFVLNSDPIFGYKFTKENAEQFWEELTQKQDAQEAAEDDLLRKITNLTI